jgi:pyridoxal phosphate enzyme (YggS family)
MSISQNLQHIRQQIHLLEQKYTRPPNSVTLLAVSKQQSVEKIQQVFAAGQRCFGENYLQEALTKINQLKALPIEWHFIGHIQANKTRAVAENFNWVHSVDSIKIAQRLDAQRPDNLPPLNVCIQVNISQESTKSGILLEQLAELAHRITSLENLTLRGLMVIPAVMTNLSEQAAIYKQVQAAQATLAAQSLKLDTLSMGMSDDFEAAIAAGSTLVRIGTAIFGARDSTYTRK